MAFPRTVALVVEQHVGGEQRRPVTARRQTVVAASRGKTGRTFDDGQRIVGVDQQRRRGRAEMREGDEAATVVDQRASREMVTGAGKQRFAVVPVDAASRRVAIVLRAGAVSF